MCSPLDLQNKLSKNIADTTFQTSKYSMNFDDYGKM